MARWSCFCLVACITLPGSVVADLEADRKRCMRKASYPAARKAFDLNSTFHPILNGEKWAELKPKVLSQDPWVVYFENFMDEPEVAALEQNLFGEQQSFFDSPAGGGSGKHLARHSETAFCTGECDDNPAIQKIRKRASDITHVPPGNFDFSQALRYKEGMFYKEHHDNHPTFHYGPSGARIFTYFVYLSDAGLVGGGTNFPQLGLTAEAKRGAAVLFANTVDRNPMETDLRTQHQSLTVEKGLKRGMNMWLYQYEYRNFWGNGCTTIDLADKLGQYGKAAAEVLPTVTLQNNAKKATLHAFDVMDRRGEVHLGAIAPGDSLVLQSVEGNVIQVRTAVKGGKKLVEYSVLGKAKQLVNIGKKAKKEDGEAEKADL